MTRRGRIAVVSSSVVLLLLLAAAGAGFAIVQSGWLRAKIQQRIVEEAERATGGKVEIGALRFDWKTLRAEAGNLVIHGTEAANAEPLLAVKRVVVGLRIVSLLDREFDVQSIEADAPRAHLILQPGGATNLPRPKTRQGKSVPETILALRIGRFQAVNGALTVDRADGGRTVTPWNARGENLNARMTYSDAGPRYEGAISVAPLNLAWDGLGTFGIEIAANVSFEKNRLAISSARLKSAQSELDLTNVALNGFGSFSHSEAPVATAQYRARISLAEADRIFKFVNFQHTGEVTVAGDLRFVSPSDYTITGAAEGTGIGYGKLPGMRIAANLTATPGNIAVKRLRASALGGEMAAGGEVRNLEDFELAGTVSHLDTRVFAALGTSAKLPYDGLLSGPFVAKGKLREPNLHRITASATLSVAPAPGSIPVQGTLVSKYDGMTESLEFGPSVLQLPNTRLEFSGVPGSRLDVSLQSQDWRDIAPVVNLKPLLEHGSFSFHGTVSGLLNDPNLAGHAAIQNTVYRGQQIDSLTGDFTAGKTQLTMNNAALRSGNLRLRINGSAGLNRWRPAPASPVSARVQIDNADFGKVLALAGQKNLPVSGTLNTTAQVTGTLGEPHATADLTLSKGEICGEPYDTIAGRAQYVNGGAQLLTADVSAGKKRLKASIRLEQPGKLAFTLTSNAMALGQIALVRKIEPDAAGTAQFRADGALRIANSRVDVTSLNADIRATGLVVAARGLGDVHIAAGTKNGVMTARVDSNAAKSSIHGEGTVRLAGDYPVSGRLTFSDASLSAVAALVRGHEADLNLDGSAAGEVTLSGSARSPDSIAALLSVNQFELHPLKLTGDAQKIPDLRLRNNGPIRARMSRMALHFESARFTAPETDLALTGGIALNSHTPLDLHLQGTMNLALARTWSPNLTSSGDLDISAAVRGSFTNPDLSGRAELRKGEFHYAELTNGLANANGVFLFSGSRMTIQSLSAETGGGKVDATGFAAVSAGLLNFRVEAKTRGVRVRYPEGVSSMTDADLTFAGTAARSEVSGNVTIRRVAINPRSDFSTILAGAAQPARTQQGATGLLANMNLDVQVETATDVAFETSVAQSIEADANLRVRGTVTNPAVIGRVNITQGEISFFGNKYAINQGSISFFNPARIDPILNVDLETKARGVDVVLTVAGPLNKLNVSYRSDPPLQFADIVALLATGRTPTDPTLAIRDTGQLQSLQQIGASALISQAIANPVAGRLQRFFGVSKIKIDPQLTGITGSPEARLTMEQQVSPDLLFTYITDVSSTSTQLIRVEWNLNRQWSAILTREENGYVGVDFAFRKRFK